VKSIGSWLIFFFVDKLRVKCAVKEKENVTRLAPKLKKAVSDAYYQPSKTLTPPVLYQ
jgi:hypothetical protein